MDYHSLMVQVRKVLNGLDGMGADIPNLDALAYQSIPTDPSEKGDSRLMVCADFEEHPGMAISPVLTAFPLGGDAQEWFRLEVVGRESPTLQVSEHGSCEALNPVDTAIELKGEDVRALDRTLSLYGEWHGYLREYLQATLKQPVDPESLIGLSIPGVKHEGTLYLNWGSGAVMKAIRPDGTILPLGSSLYDPKNSLYGEREEIIRPRIEELREQIETRREEALEEMTPEERKAFYMAQDMEGKSLDPVEWLNS